MIEHSANMIAIIEPVTWSQDNVRNHRRAIIVPIRTARFSVNMTQLDHRRPIRCSIMYHVNTIAGILINDPRNLSIASLSTNFARSRCMKSMTNSLVISKKANNRIIWNKVERRKNNRTLAKHNSDRLSSSSLSPSKLFVSFKSFGVDFRLFSFLCPFCSYVSPKCVNFCQNRIKRDNYARRMIMATRRHQKQWRPIK